MKTKKTNHSWHGFLQTLIDVCLLNIWPSSVIRELTSLSLELLELCLVTLASVASKVSTLAIEQKYLVCGEGLVGKLGDN